MKKVVCLSVVCFWVLGMWTGITVSAATPKEGAFQSKELVFESDRKKTESDEKRAKEERIKAIREKRMKERKPLTDEERKKRQQEAISKKYQGMIQQQEAVTARWMKIRALAQQEKAVLTIKEIDLLITEKREQIKEIKQRMNDALHPEQARQRRMAEKKRLMEEKRAKYKADQELRYRDKESKRDYRDQGLKREKKEKKQKEEL